MPKCCHGALLEPIPGLIGQDFQFIILEAANFHLMSNEYLKRLLKWFSATQSQGFVGPFATGGCKDYVVSKEKKALFHKPH